MSNFHTLNPPQCYWVTPPVCEELWKSRAWSGADLCSYTLRISQRMRICFRSSLTSEKKQGRYILRFNLKGQLSRQRTQAPLSSDPYLCWFSLTLGCVRDEGAQHFMQSHLTSSRAKAGTLWLPSHWHGSDLAASPAVISQGEPDVIDLLLRGVWLSPHTDPSQDTSHNFIPFLQGAEASSLYLSDGLYWEACLELC